MIGRIMTLSEILQRLDSFDEEGTIIAAKPWTPTSLAEVIDAPASGVVSEMARDGMVYFLEVAIVRELVDDWSSGRCGEALCERLIQYAINDA